LWEDREVKKEYLAIVHGHVREEHGVIDAPLGKDEFSHVAIKDCVRADGAVSRTEFYVERRFTRAEGDFSLLRIVPFTGCKHQIRIHLAHLGHPIVGDKIYGADEDLYLALVEDRLTEPQRAALILPHHALHSARITFSWRQETRAFNAQPESWFEVFAAEE
jgi:23S rRNA pseudouridine1911/1915/1917 synthase